MFKEDQKQSFSVMTQKFKKDKMFSELEDEIRIRLFDREEKLNQELINEIDPDISNKI